MAASDARYCEHLTCRHARTFSLASLFLPPAKRRATYALYAFCREADDIVDRSPRLVDRHAISQRLDAHRRALDAALAGQPDGPVFRELAWAIAHFGVPAAPLLELLDGVAMDVTISRWSTWAELQRYCEGVAGSVGEMCVSVMGLRAADGERAAAVAHARALGVAMQLTNVLRDVGEDAGRGRCYLPAEELAQHGFTHDDVVTGRALRRRAEWKAFMRQQVARARGYYALAAPGISMLEPDAQRCATACAMGYSRILDIIERNGYDSHSRRASLGWSERARLLGSCLFGAPTPVALGAPPAADTPAVTAA